MEIKKIILNSAKNDNKTGVLSLTVENKATQIKIKSYNFDLDDNHILLLKNEQNKYELQLDKTVISLPVIDLTKKISCLVIKKDGVKSFPVLWGGTSRDEQQDVQASVMPNEDEIDNQDEEESETVKVDRNEQFDTENEFHVVDKSTIKNIEESNFAVETNKKKEEQKANKEPKANESIIFGGDYTHIEKNVEQNGENVLINDETVNLFESNDEQIKEEIQKHINNSDGEIELSENEKKNVSNIEQVNDALLTLSEIQGAIKENIAQSIPFGEPVNPKETSFYNLIKNQYDDMFAKYEGYKYLSEVIPNSKWIKVDCDNDYYVLGLIYEEDEPKFMCYGIPQTLRKTPPVEMREFGQWLPLDMDNPDGAGFYIMYQSAQTGENIKVEVI